MVCVIGCCEDKDIDGILTGASRGGDKFFFTKAKSNPRTADPRDLQRRFQEVSGKMSRVAGRSSHGSAGKPKAVGRDDIICVIGSYYLAGEAKQAGGPPRGQGSGSHPSDPNGLKSSGDSIKQGV